MSLLAPLYALGALAIALPILFHLIRRRPKAEAQFSSLMFLSPSPPRLTRRSRLDQWPLLLLRALAIVLIALAFARPFLRSAASRQIDLIGRRVVVLLDTSGSMQRDDLWKQAQQQVEAVIESSGGKDQIALMTFDSDVRTVVPFDRTAEGVGKTQAQRIREATQSLQPTFAQSRLGAALIEAADLLMTTDDANDSSVTIPNEIVIVSDLQSGCDLTPLQAYEWPDSISVSIATVSAEKTGNLSATVLPQVDTSTGSGPPQLRIRFTNTSDSSENQFMYFWENSTDSQDHVAQIPAGESRIVRVDVPPSTSGVLRFVGDMQDFDNQAFVVLPEKQRRQVLFIGPAANESDPLADLFYFLRQVTLGDYWREVSFQRVAVSQEPLVVKPSSTPLVIVGDAIDTETVTALRKYLSDGGNVLFVIDQSKSGYMATETTLRELSDDASIAIAEAAVDDYAMLEKIDFTDPIFQPFADPKFNDFTRIRFWSHRDLTLDSSADWQAIASFDDDSPAIVQQKIGAGRLLVLAAGWQPQQSQLALSSKFVPLLAGMMQRNQQDAVLRAGYDIGDEGVLPTTLPCRLMWPDGTTQTIAEPMDLKDLTLPGIYQITSIQAEEMAASAVSDSQADDNAEVETDGGSDGTTDDKSDDKSDVATDDTSDDQLEAAGDVLSQQTVRFAMNLPASESQTVPLSQEDLEKFSVNIQGRQSAAEIEAVQRQLQDVELESQQRLWQWLIVAAIVILILETLLATRLARKQQALT